MRSVFHYLEAEDPLSLLEEDYRRLEEAHRRYNAFITLQQWDSLRPGQLLTKPLNAMPIPVKDNISTEGLRTTCGSKILSNYIPPYDAYTVEILREIGGLIIGKTNMDEFAMGSTSETGFTGPVRNPWNTSYVAGGSSGGSAVTVAYAGGVSLGSDTGGSVRLPAAYNYVLGLKPTYGLLSRYGLISYADSLEQIGLFARYPRDMAYILHHLSRLDPRDRTMYRGGEREELRSRLLNLFHGTGFEEDIRISIGYSTKLIELADDEVAAHMYNVLERLHELGFELKELDLSYMEAGLPTYYVIAMAEASSNLMRYDGVPYGDLKWYGDYWRSIAETRTSGFGDEVKRRIIFGGLISSSGYKGRYYLRALRLRRWIRDKLLETLREVDMIFMPTQPSPPPRLGEVEGPDAYALDIYTVIPNLTGHPAINIPAGFVYGLPIGFQLITRYHGEDLLIYVAEKLRDVVYDPSKEVVD